MKTNEDDRQNPNKNIHFHVLPYGMVPFDTKCNLEINDKIAFETYSLSLSLSIEKRKDFMACMLTPSIVSTCTSPA